MLTDPCLLLLGNVDVEPHLFTLPPPHSFNPIWHSQHQHFTIVLSRLIYALSFAAHRVPSVQTASHALKTIARVSLICQRLIDLCEAKSVWRKTQDENPKKNVEDWLMLDTASFPLILNKMAKLKLISIVLIQLLIQSCETRDKKQWNGNDNNSYASSSSKE